MEITHLFHLRLLGPFEAHVQGALLPAMRSRKESWLLALLALYQGSPVSRDWLAQTLWPSEEYPTDLARAYLRRSLWQLKRAMGNEAYRIRSTAGHQLSLDLAGAYLDVADFDDAVRQTDGAGLDRAIALYRGPLLEECGEEWAKKERTARFNALREALHNGGLLARSQNDSSRAVRYFQRAIALDPFWETAYHALMETQAAARDYTGAVDVYRDLQKRLHVEKNEIPNPETRAIFRRIQWEQRRALQADQSVPEVESGAAAVPSLKKFSSLPVYLTEILGRETEIAEVLERSKQRRLVTLTGPGGVGKTRVAVEAAKRMAGQFIDGVRFVDLAGLLEPTLLTGVVASILGPQETSAGSREETLLKALGQRELLLVLDGCEHLTADCGQLIRTILAACPGVRCLVTGRQSLGIAGETAQCIRSLTVPNLDPLLQAEPNVLSVAGRSAAVCLFIERAQEAQPSFQMTRENMVALIELCRLLDGIPLALELAAAQMRAISVPELLERLQRHFGLLKIQGPKQGLQRHRTLRAVMDWSASLLTDAEQNLLGALSIFRGGFTLQAAEGVCGSDDLPEAEVFVLMQGLVDKSHVIAELVESETRYRLLESVRQFHEERRMEKRDRPEKNALAARHAQWFVGFAERAEPDLSGGDQQVCLNRLAQEQDNFRAALRWSVENAEAEVGLRLAGALWRFWYIRGMRQEEAHWLAQVLARGVKADRGLHARALNGAGNIAYRQMNYSAARASFEQALALRSEMGDTTGIAAAFGNLANIAHAEQDYQQARELLMKSLALFEKAGDKKGKARTLANLALAAFRERDYPQARALHEQSLRLFRDLGDREDIALALSNRAYALCFQETQTQEALAEADSRLAEGLALYEESQNWRGVTRCVTISASVAAVRGDYREAAVLIGAQESLRKRIDYPLPSFAREEYEQNRQRVRAALRDPSFTDHREQGAGMTLQQAAEFLRSYLSR